MSVIENLCLLLGRLLIGSYFIFPGIMKIANYQATTDSMLAHNVPITALLLPITIIIQIVAGLAIIIGFKGKLAAFILAGLTFVISVYMHNFWSLDDGLTRAHEMQNFIKNMAIMAGLLMLVNSGTGKFSLDNRRLNKI